MSDPQPAAEVRDRAVRELVRSKRSCWAIGAGALCIGAVGVGLVLSNEAARFSLLIAAIGLSFGALYLVAGWRKHVAAKCVRGGPYRAVRVQGWCRPPDGCNYGIFESIAVPEGARPSWVMRLPLRREMFTGPAWLCGTPDLAAAALVGVDGAVLGAGRIRPTDDGLRVWYRRETPPGHFVARPPEDFLPPGG